MDDGDHEILEHFRRTREKTLELIRRVPDGFLSRPVEGEDGDLAKALLHAGCSGSWWLPNVLGADGPARDPGAADREGIIAAVESVRDVILDFFSAEDGARLAATYTRTDEDGTVREWTGRNRLLYFISHEVHHRGKIVLACQTAGLQRAGMEKRTVGVRGLVDAVPVTRRRSAPPVPCAIRTWGLPPPTRRSS